MPKKDAAPEKTSPKPKKSKDVTVEPKDSEEPLDEIKEAPVKEKKSKKKVSKKRAKLSVLQAAVLETIRERPQRPGAIQTIIFSAGGVDIPRNEIIRSLNELQEKGLVEKVTAKAWQAT